ncbi:MAG: TlpA disulfide reductase family protein [Bacteroidales bacterium]|nr:TlpA disulfide reductase family protein [Bacteroidales bacterium]
MKYFNTIIIFIFLQTTPFLLISQSFRDVPTIDFKTFEPWLKKQNDTTYVINFWATWCAPCVKELPDFEKINKKYESQKFKMLLVSLDFLRDKEKRLIPFLEKNQLRAEVTLLHAPNANVWIDIVDKSWSGAIPATLIYKNNRKVFHEGGYTFDELDQIISKLITN